MGIRAKFNLGMVGVFLVALGIAGWRMDEQFSTSARRAVLHDASILLSAANAVRQYTIDEIVPLVAGADPTWIAPITVPSYAAQAAFRLIRREHPEFVYREAALNPTNPTDRALDWEADFINAFRNDQTLRELIGERMTPTGPVLTVARPITIRDEACLACHSTPDRAPPRMIEVYGSSNGFGWRMGETVGAQLISVPMKTALEQAWSNMTRTLLGLFGMFLGLMVMLNLLLHFVVIRPVTRMARGATAVSMGQSADADDFADQRRDEIGELGRAFSRMRRSMEQALKMLGS